VALPSADLEPAPQTVAVYVAPETGEPHMDVAELTPRVTLSPGAQAVLVQEKPDMPPAAQELTAELVPITVFDPATHIVLV
jgi:hypothetical protein